jgi:hypothetical protein
MRLVSIRKNMNEVIEGNPEKTTLYSYQTPVARHIEGKGVYITNKKCSATTTWHINEWCERHGFRKERATTVDPEWFETGGKAESNGTVKTIDVNAKEWFDKAAGNSYFSAAITLNYGMDDARTIDLPFQYGYGDHYLDMANQALDVQGIIGNPAQSYGGRIPLWNYCKDHGIILRYSKQTGCKKREL